MAIAGRVLLMPKGAYDASVTYEMLDMVSYDGVTWVAKKTCVGIIPSADTSEYWFAMVGVSSEDFEAFKNEVLDDVNELINDSVTATDAKIKEVNDSLSDYVPLAGGEMTGALKAVNPNADAEGVRNITAGTTDLVAGTSELTTGSIYIVYE
jgi:hypothetical protein